MTGESIDIGKIGTPENILHKSEELDTDEMSKLKEHPLIGARVIERIKKLTFFVSQVDD